MNLTAKDARSQIQILLGTKPDGKISLDPEGETLRAFRTLAQLPGESPWPPLPSADPVPLPVDAGFDERTERLIATLLPPVQDVARQFLADVRRRGIDARIISGTRTYEEQDELYAQGRSKPGRIVTKAPAGYSNHNFGIAFDIGIFDGSKYLDESPLYRKCATIAKDHGLTWGGDWQSIQDEPHYELHPAWAHGMSESAMLAELRERKSGGQLIFA